MFNLDDYEPVESRIKAFWEKYPEGRIHTELVHFDNNQFIVKAMIWTDRQDPIPVTIDYAHEVVGNSPVNKNFALANGATSAIGRALADLNFAPKGKRPSREEMAKVIEMDKIKKEKPLDWGVNDTPLPPEPDFDPFQQWPEELKVERKPVVISEPNFREASLKQRNFMFNLFMQQAAVNKNLLTAEGQAAYCEEILGKPVDVNKLSSKEASAIIKALQSDLGQS